ncbi:hypothetical protein [Citreimonas sp.]|uniref:hypothetical protein n=1 Tax=Citreimonas sp. TaxID=3036715 RepID=UPI004058F396
MKRYLPNYRVQRIIVSEAGDCERFESALIEQLTEGTPIEVRLLHSDFAQDKDSRP